MPNETYDWDEASAKLRQRADEDFPGAWQPEEVGDELLGVVRRVVMQAPTSYGPSPVVELETEGGSFVSVWLFHKVLRQSFERERVRLGEVVLIRYLGKKRPEGGGNAYDNYRLVVDRREEKGEPDWAGMAERYGDESAGAIARGAADPDLPLTDADSTPDDDIPF